MTTSIGEEARVLAQDVKAEWKQLWRERIDDKVRAEGVADRCFLLLAVEKGTVIVATRDYKVLDLKEILRSQCGPQVEQALGPNPATGGWTKFARTVLTKQDRVRRLNEARPTVEPSKNSRQKQGGRGWLHRS